MQVHKNTVCKPGKTQHYGIGYRQLSMLSIAALFSLFMTYAAFADMGGSFPVPELEGPPGISIENEAVTTCAIDMGWPTGSEVLSFSLDTSSGGPTGSGQMVIYHPNDPIADPEIYVFFKVDDNTVNEAPAQMDKLVLMFDLFHDHTVADTSSFNASDDRGIRFDRDGTVQQVYGDITNMSVESALSDADTCVSENSDTGWVMEAKLTPSDLGLSNFNDLMGIAVMAEDWNIGTAERSKWPSTATATPNTWANLVTRSPIDFVLLVDQSGSMTGDKWSSARQAANNFRAMLLQFHDTDLASEFSTLGLTNGGDRLGLATFTTGEPNNAAIYRNLASIDITPVDYTSVLPASPGGATPIASGVNKTFEMFGGATHLDDSDYAIQKVIRQKVVILLSDGKHNTPSTTMNFDSEGIDFTYLPVTPNCDNNATVESYVRINAVAIGSDATVDTGKLDDIKNCFSGSRYTNIYNIVGADEPEMTADLSLFYFQTVYPYYHLNAITDTGNNVTIKAGESRLLFFAFWAGSGSVTGLSVTLPDNVTVASIAPMGSVINADAGECPSGLGYCYLLFKNPDDGTYSDYTASGALSNGKYALVDLRVEARFAIDNQPHGTSSTITLRGRLQEDGKPILGADVSVDVRRPEEGFGTVASTTSLDGCRTVEPTLPDFDPIGSRGATNLASNIAFSSANLAVQAKSIKGDVNPPAYALMDALLEVCGKDGLAQDQDTGLKLYDDGTHGDTQADDGIYILVFDNTEIEGSYIFRFTADGTMSNGQSFARLKEIGEYVRLDVDPGSTEFDSRIMQQVGFNTIEEYYIIPRDAHGGYLGPGHSDQIEFIVSEAVKLGGVRDYNNGIYSQIIKYNENQDKPVVTATVQGKKLSPIKAIKPFEIEPFIGRFFFNNSLGLDDGAVVGARLGYRLTNQLVLELEGAVTFTEDTAGDSGHVYQALANVRYDMYSLRVGRLVPYVTAGAGYVFFRGFGMDDEAPVVHGGAGSTLELGRSFGIRVDGRVFQIGSAMNAGATTNIQVTGGLVFRF